MLAHGTDVAPIKITGDRIQLKSYIQVGGSMLCPLVRPIDLEIDSASDTYVYSSYAFWGVCRFAPQGVAHRRMDKLGDRMKFDVDRSDGAPGLPIPPQRPGFFALC